MRASTFLLTSVIMFCYCDAAFSQNSALRTTSALYRAAKVTCEGVYGTGKPADVDEGALRYYCPRLVHPETWVRDQEWWKRYAPQFLQAEEKPRSDPFSVQREIQAQSDAEKRCRERGG